METYLLRSDANNELSISDISISDADYNTGNPYNTTLNVKVTSGEFSGLGNFVLDVSDLCSFIMEIFALYSNLCGHAVLQDIGHGSVLELSAKDSACHIEVSGVIYDEAKTQSLKYRFNTDQSYLHPFCKKFYDDLDAFEGYSFKSAHLDNFTKITERFR